MKSKTHLVGLKITILALLIGGIGNYIYGNYINPPWTHYQLEPAPKEIGIIHIAHVDFNSFTLNPAGDVVYVSGKDGNIYSNTLFQSKWLLVTPRPKWHEERPTECAKEWTGWDTLPIEKEVVDSFGTRTEIVDQEIVSQCYILTDDGNLEVWVHSRSNLKYLLGTPFVTVIIPAQIVAILGIIIAVITFRVRTGKTNLFVRRKYLALIVLLALVLPALLYYSYFEWEMKKFSDSLQPFDETEFLKTHYQGVDCSSLVGSVTFGDYGIPAQAACIGERAWYESNIELCNHINGCMVWIAVKTGDLEICKQLKPERAPSMEDKLIRDKQQNVSQYGCEQSVAIYRDMPAICDSIPYSNEHYRQECKEKATDGETYLQFKVSPMRPYCVEYNSNGKCVW